MSRSPKTHSDGLIRVSGYRYLPPGKPYFLDDLVRRQHALSRNADLEDEIAEAMDGRFIPDCPIGGLIAWTCEASGPDLYAMLDPEWVGAVQQDIAEDALDAGQEAMVEFANQAMPALWALARL